MLEFIFGRSYWFEYTLNEIILGKGALIVAFIIFTTWIILKIRRDHIVGKGGAFREESLKLIKKQDAIDPGDPKYSQIKKDTKKALTVLRKKYTKRHIILSKIQKQLNLLADNDERTAMARAIARELGMVIEIVSIEHRDEPEKRWYQLRLPTKKEATVDTEDTKKVKVEEVVEPPKTATEKA